MVRFFQGSAQKIKGWEKFSTLVGVARDMHAWLARWHEIQRYRDR